LRNFEDVAPLTLLQLVAAALFTATVGATPISSLVTRLSGGDATAISKTRIIKQQHINNNKRFIKTVLCEYTIK